MGPIGVTPGVALPVDPADQPARGELELGGERDRRAKRFLQRRRQEQEENPDGDEFRHQESEEETGT
jgi:hypothetical protein